MLLLLQKEEHLKDQCESVDVGYATLQYGSLEGAGFRPNQPTHCD